MQNTETETKIDSETDIETLEMVQQPKKRNRNSTYVKGGPHTESYRLAKLFFDSTIYLPSYKRRNMLINICLREHASSEAIMRSIHSLKYVENNSLEINKINEETTLQEIHKLSDSVDYKESLRFASNPSRTLIDIQKQKKGLEAEVNRLQLTIQMISFYENKIIKDRNNINQISMYLLEIASKC